MKLLRILICLFILLVTAVGAETLGEAVEFVAVESQSVAARITPPETWGQETALADLRSLIKEAHTLTGALSGNDAWNLEERQDQFTMAVRQVRTSQVMLGAAEQRDLEQVLEKAEQVNDRLKQLRLRFAGMAATVPGSLADTPLTGGSDEIDGYTNIADVLTDVRWARELVASLQAGRFPPYGFGFNTPNNLDPLRVRRTVQAAWALERALTTERVDVARTIPEWNEFYQEYNRLGYPGADSRVRRLERVMERLQKFYGDL